MYERTVSLPGTLLFDNSVTNSNPSPSVVQISISDEPASSPVKNTTFAGTSFPFKVDLTENSTPTLAPSTTD